MPGSSTSCTKSLGFERQLTAESAQHVYDQIGERLRSPEFRPRALFRRFNIEVLATTDAATATLEHHRRLRERTSSSGSVSSRAFGPTQLFRIAAPGWASELACFEQMCGAPIGDYSDFVAALARRRR